MSEHAHQSALISWARRPDVQRQYPGIDLLHSSLNGVKLSKAQAGKAKAAGMLAGVYDLCLPVRRCGFSGLWVEMKFAKNKLTAEQEWFGKRLIDEGFHVATCWDWLEARQVIIKYLTQIDMFADAAPFCRVCGGSEIKPTDDNKTT